MQEYNVRVAVWHLATGLHTLSCSQIGCGSEQEEAAKDLSSCPSALPCASVHPRLVSARAREGFQPGAATEMRDRGGVSKSSKVWMTVRKKMSQVW